MSKIPDDVVEKAINLARWAICKHAGGAGEGICSDPVCCLPEAREAVKAAGDVFVEWALEKAAKACEGTPTILAGNHVMRDEGTAHFWDMDSIYGKSRLEAADRVRALKDK